MPVLCAIWLQGVQSNVETHGFTHHQKTAIVDRTGSDGRRHLVVFTGGLDITQRMADSSDHPLDAWRGGARHTAVDVHPTPNPNRLRYKLFRRPRPLNLALTLKLMPVTTRTQALTDPELNPYTPLVQSPTQHADRMLHSIFGGEAKPQVRPELTHMQVGGTGCTQVVSSGTQILAACSASCTGFINRIVLPAQS